MAKLIKGSALVDNDWSVLGLPAAAELPGGPVLVPLNVWQAQREALQQRHDPVGVWLAADENPADLAGDADRLAVIGVHFPAAGDGRGYSIATLLRTRYGYRGELRAFGAIGRDQLFFLQRAGFDAIAVDDPERAIAGLGDFSLVYQTAADGRAPLFRRAANVVDCLRQAVSDHGAVVFANSLGAEDMVLTDLIWRNDIAIPVFLLDTGRLPAETYELIATAERHYGRRIDIRYPDREPLEQFVASYGINGFYDSIEARKACCHARKVVPLGRALAGQRAWVTGLRAAQSSTREAVQTVAFDSVNGLVKINPLADWDEREVWNYLRTEGVPYNRLHDRNYPSIGCAPCTRAIQPGEDIRAGRWWWESPATKECGLHLVDGKLQRKVGAGGTAQGDQA